MWPQLILSGIAIGSMYGLVALGFQVTFAVSNTMNFSQGAFVMVGDVLCYSFNITWGLPAIAAVPLTLIICIGLGLLVERWVRLRLQAAQTLLSRKIRKASSERVGTLFARPEHARTTRL